MNIVFILIAAAIFLVGFGLGAAVYSARGWHRGYAVGYREGDTVFFTDNKVEEW